MAIAKALPGLKILDPYFSFDLKHVKAWLVPWKDPLRRLNLISIKITLVLDLRSPKTRTNRNLAFLNRVRYFYGGHVSYDVIIRAIVKPQMGWECLP